MNFYDYTGATRSQKEEFNRNRGRLLARWRRYGLITEQDYKRQLQEVAEQCRVVINPVTSIRVGGTYGRLTVTSLPTQPYNQHQKVITCVCVCGKQVVTNRVMLMSRECGGCGCKRTAPRLHFEKGARALHVLFSRYKTSGRRTCFTLDFEHFKSLVLSPCAYCGTLPSRACRDGQDQILFNGIDRIDSSNGYTPENVVACCTTCNFAKGSMPAAEFKAWALQQYVEALPLDNEDLDVALRSILTTYRSRAKKVRLTFTLSDHQLKALVQENCTYCGTPPRRVWSVSDVNGGQPKAARLNGIDRVDSSQGYVPENCVACCPACNYAKRKLSLDDFTAWLKQLRLNLQKLQTVATTVTDG